MNRQILPPLHLFHTRILDRILKMYCYYYYFIYLAPILKHLFLLLQKVVKSGLIIVCMRVSFPPFHFLPQENLIICTDMQSLSSDERQFLVSTGWFNLIRKFGKLDFVCQQNCCLKHLKNQRGWSEGGGIRQMGQDIWNLKQILRNHLYSHKTKCVFTENNTWRGWGASFALLNCSLGNL